MAGESAAASGHEEAGRGLTSSYMATPSMFSATTTGLGAALTLAAATWERSNASACRGADIPGNGEDLAYAWWCQSHEGVRRRGLRASLPCCRFSVSPFAFADCGGAHQHHPCGGRIPGRRVREKEGRKVIRGWGGAKAYRSHLGGRSGSSRQLGARNSSGLGLGNGDGRGRKLVVGQATRWRQGRRR